MKFMKFTSSDFDLTQSLGRLEPSGLLETQGPDPEGGASFEELHLSPNNLVSQHMEGKALQAPWLLPSITESGVDSPKTHPRDLSLVAVLKVAKHVGQGSVCLTLTSSWASNYIYLKPRYSHL